MRMLENFLVRLPKRFKDTIKVNGQELYLDPKFDEFQHRVMQGEVVSVPMRYEKVAEPGDTLYFHHHVVMDKGQGLKYNDEEIFIVRYHPDVPYASQAFAVKDEDGIRVLSQWVLLEPIKEDNQLKSDTIQIISFEEEENKRGKIAFINETLEEAGLRVGDTVGFSKNSDYEIEIEGKKYWRMRFDDLLYVEIEEVHDA
jgi:co-chaperonin GroES (HSP10)